MSTPPSSNSVRTVELSDADREILFHLQSSPRGSTAELADKVNSSVSPVWRRIKRLEEQGVIQGYELRLNKQALGFGIDAFVFVKITTHAEKEAEEFEAAVKAIDRVLSCHILSGSDDYLVRIVARDLDDYATFGRKVIATLPHVREVRSAFILHTIKESARLPIE